MEIKRLGLSFEKKRNSIDRRRQTDSSSSGVSHCANSCRGKAVLLTVYVEKPRRRSSSRNKHHHHHHHHHYHHLHHNNRHVAAGGNTGYNRRAQLLQYSQNLRDHSASTNHPPKTNQVPNTPPLNDKRYLCLYTCIYVS
ncbi:hypothetical protein HS088_TW16G00694 [Tripterygium wilfordii]|uniref:Uncharacterized protein n=1 Tax=Tripterygium wilfordii TaxID=458696 RepID=A0A7J7CJK7_TRIWF|nr:hypothetical protein HS088_TW16G00694 [Tripterygium wilfordii]